MKKQRKTSIKSTKAGDKNPYEKVKSSDTKKKNSRAKARNSHEEVSISDLLICGRLFHPLL